MGSKKFSMMAANLDPITIAYVNGMTTRPSAAFVQIINQYFVKNKKTVNGVVITAKSIIAKADVMYLGNINDSDDSFRNLAKNAHHGTKQGSGLVWDAYWGYSNPAGTGYVDTNYNPSTQGVNYTQNNAGFAINLHNNIAASAQYPIGVKSTNTIGFNVNTDSFAINQLALLARTSIPFRAGLHGFYRTLSNAINAKNQNLANTTGTNASTSIPSGNIHLFNCNGLTVYYLGGLNFTYIGASLSDDEFTALNLIVNEYLKQCLYLKYGASNWGVQMAKSYFDTLHNFEPYEAFEIYEFIKRHQSDYVDSSGIGYYYNTFQPTKTVADYIMLFKAGGNLVVGTWVKTGDTTRWNHDGTITSINSFPAYTRGTNLGIITVSSTDGWNALSLLFVPQTSGSVNCCYGNFPMFEKIKSTNTYLSIGNTRWKADLRNSNFSVGLICSGISNPGYVKINMNRFVGGPTLSGYLYIYAITSPTSEITGDMSLWTNEYISTRAWQVYTSTSNRIMEGLIGTLNNFILSNNTNTINLYCTGITGGFLNWNKNLSSCNLSNNYFSTTAVDSQLSVINTYFAAITPIQNLTLNLSGATMGIPTGGASNADLLGIVAKHTAAGFTATITVRIV